MKRVWFALLLSLMPVDAALSCTCATPTFEEQMKVSAAVFTGRVLSSAHDGEQLAVTIEVMKRWKGPNEKTIVISTPENSAGCGYSFENGRAYLVYATGKEKLEVSLCSRTRLLTEAKEDLDSLEVTVPGPGRRDPFTEMKGDRGIHKRIPRELNVTNAVIVGITRKTDGYVALVRARNNKVYFLKPGDKLHDGVVVKIDGNTVIFRQYTGSRSVLVTKRLRPFPD